MAITLRTIKGTALTHAELDGNFTELDTRLDTVETTLSSDPDIGNEDIDFGSNVISYSNTVADEASLANYNPNTYTGMTVHVASTGALYYAHNGAWRKLLTDVTYGSPATQGYVNPLSNVAYTGSFNDLIDVPPVFSFDGSYTSLTNKPTIPQDISELADINSLLFSGSYNDLTNKPAIPVDISTLTDNNNVIPQDIDDLTDNNNRLITTTSQLTNDSGYITLDDIPDTGAPVIPDLQSVTTVGAVTAEEVTFNGGLKVNAISPLVGLGPTVHTGNFDIQGTLSVSTSIDVPTGTITATSFEGDTKGSVFGDDSTLLVDGVNNIIPAANLSGTLPALDGSNLTGITVPTALPFTKFVFTNSQPGSSTANSAYIGETLGTWYECTFANAANTFGLSPDSADRDPTLTGITFSGDRFSGFEQGGTYEFHISPELYERTTNAGIRIHSWEVSTGAFSNMSVYSPGTGSFNINGLSCNDHIVVTFEDATPANNWIRYALDSDQSNIYWIGQAILHIKKIA